MFSFFRSTPKWQSEKPQKRIESLADLNPAVEDDKRILTKLACEDSSAEVRAAAVRHLSDMDTVQQILKRDDDKAVREAANKQLVALLCNTPKATLNLEARLEQIERINNPEILGRLVHEADEIEIRLAALANLKDEAQLDSIVRESPLARIRQAAAERITSTEALESLARFVQQKDKTVYRIIRGRLDDIHQKEKQEALLHKQQEDLCLAMETHARAAFNPLYAAKTESLRQQWVELANHAHVQLTERFETALGLATQQINEVRHAEQSVADKARAGEEQLQCVEALEATLNAWQGQEDFNPPALSALLTTQRLRWDFANKLQEAKEGLTTRYNKACKQLDALEKLIFQWQTERKDVEPQTDAEQSADNAEANRNRLLAIQAEWQAHSLILPESLQKLAGVTPKRVPSTAKSAASAESGNKLEGILGEVADQIKKGNSKQASRLLRKARDFAKEQHLHSVRLNELADQVRELQSWAGFAVLPKKEALVAQMRDLVSRTMDPDDKADAIHALQEEWKALGVADSNAEQPLWVQFKQAADEAFEPCRHYFAEQREMRHKNLEARRALCEQLQGYLDALPENPDWKAHEALLRTARQEWLQHHPSDRQETRGLKERFDTLLKALDAPLQAYRQQNEKSKRELIDLATALANETDTRVACDKAKALQQQWKAIGQAHPKADRDLWQRFRTSCDAIFSKRDAEFQARKAEREASVTQAEGLIASMTALAESTDSALQSSAEQLNDAFQTLQLPKEKFSDLRDKFHAARRKVDQLVKEQKQAAQREKQDAILAEWQALANESADTEKANSTLLDLEILLDISSPPAWQAARQARQMQQLQERGLRRASKDEADKLIQELLQTPVTPKELAAITERLRPLLSKAGH